jgi:hypothetical protein
MCLAGGLSVLEPFSVGSGDYEQLQVVAMLLIFAW